MFRTDTAHDKSIGLEAQISQALISTAIRIPETLLKNAYAQAHTQLYPLWTVVLSDYVLKSFPGDSEGCPCLRIPGKRDPVFPMSYFPPRPLST